MKLQKATSLRELEVHMGQPSDLTAKQIVAAILRKYGRSPEYKAFEEPNQYGEILFRLSYPRSTVTGVIKGKGIQATKYHKRGLATRVVDHLVFK